MIRLIKTLFFILFFALFFATLGISLYQMVEQRIENYNLMITKMSGLEQKVQDRCYLIRTESFNDNGKVLNITEDKKYLYFTQGNNKIKVEKLKIKPFLYGQ